MLTIFKGLEGNWSIDRYAGELAESFGAAAEVRTASVPLRPGIRGKLFDKYLGYPRYARRMQSEQNLIVSEGYAFLLRALDTARTIVVCHDVLPLLYPGRDFLYRRLFRLNLRIMARAHRIVTVSENTRRQLLAHCPEIQSEKVVAVHSGLHPRWRKVEDTIALASFRRRYSLEDTRIVLHVGSDVWYKNFPALLRAFAQLQDRELLLVKAGSMSDASQTLAAQLGIGRRLRLLHNLSQEELVLLYNCAEVLVFPSLHEGFGWPPLEAMACGCPVVASDRQSIPEICGEACLYSEPEDTATLAAAVERVLAEPALVERLRQAGFRQAQLYDWSKTAARIWELFSAPAF